MAFNDLTPVKLGQAAITVAEATLYTVPELTRAFVKDIDICNTTDAPITVDVFLVPDGDSASSDNALLSNIEIPASAVAGGLLQWTGSQVLNAGDTIETSASAVGLTINASGIEAV